MKYLYRLFLEARPYWILLIISSLSLFGLTAMNLMAPWLIRDLFQTISSEQSPDTWPRIVRISAFLLSSYIAKGIFRFLNNYLAHKAAWCLVSDMRVKVYNHLQKLSLRFYHNQQTGQLMSRATNDTATFEVLIAHAIPDLASNVLILFGVSILLYLMNPTLAVFTLIPLPFLIFASFIFAYKIRPNMRKAQGTLAHLNATLQDNLSGMKEIQVFNQESHESKKVQNHAKTYTDAILGALQKSAMFHPGVETLSSVGTAIVVFAGGWLLLQGRVSSADIVGFVLYLSLFYQPITTLARVTEDLQHAFSGAERVFEILDTESDVQEKPGAYSISKGQGLIEFDRVFFSYQKDFPILTDISFVLKPGEMLALVGPTGVGKSTILSLLARFYDPSCGQIRIDSHPISDITLESLRNQMSIVLQDVFLFSGSVGENIAYGNKNAPIEEIYHAAKIARAHDFIEELPEGYDTQIGERGICLSGGQKQRLAIARAVLRNSPVLILDEATASVDVETESKIQEAIQELAGSKTIIVIAHRLSTVKRADKILVLEKGAIIEEGTHQELLAKKGAYTRLCEIQFPGLFELV